MRFYTASVNIGGDRNHVVVKDKLTAAEIMVLQALHGASSVHSVRAEPADGIDATPHAVIKEKLMRVYGKSRVGDTDQRPVLVSVFPGWPNVQIPADLSATEFDKALMQPLTIDPARLDAIENAEKQALALAQANADAEAAHLAAEAKALADQAEADAKIIADQAKADADANAKAQAEADAKAKADAKATTPKPAAKSGAKTAAKPGDDSFLE